MTKRERMVRTGAWLILAALLALIVGASILKPARPASAAPRLSASVQSGAGCPSTITTPYCIELQWVLSTSQATCVAPACTWVGYNVLQGSAAGGESATPINSAPVSGPPYWIPLTLGAQAGTDYFEVQAVDTSNGLTQHTNSAEVSVTFPAALQPATGVTVQAE